MTIKETESMISKREAMEALLVSIETHEKTLRRYNTDKLNLEAALDIIKRDCESLLGQAMSLED